MHVALPDVEPERADLIEARAHQFQHDSKIFETLLELATNVASADDPLLCVPGNLARDMDDVAEGCWHDRDLREAVRTAIENPGRNMDRRLIAASPTSTDQWYWLLLARDERRLDGTVELRAGAACGTEPVDHTTVASDEDLVEVPARRAERPRLVGSPAVERVAAGPETICLPARGKVTSNVESQKRLISSLLPGSCLPKSFEGTPSTMRPRSL